MSEVGLTLAVRGVMVSNANPAPGWIPVKGQKKYNERYLNILMLFDAIHKLIFFLQQNDSFRSNGQIRNVFTKCIAERLGIRLSNFCQHY